MEYFTSLLASGGMMSAVHNNAKGILVSPRALFFKQSLVKLRTVFPDSSDAYNVRSMHPPPLPFLRSSIPPSPAALPPLSPQLRRLLRPLDAAPLSHHAHCTPVRPSAMLPRAQINFGDRAAPLKALQVADRSISDPRRPTTPFELQYITFDSLPPERITTGLGGVLSAGAVAGATTIVVVFDRSLRTAVPRGRPRREGRLRSLSVGWMLTNGRERV